MTITEYADAINVSIVIEYVHNSTWRAELEDSVIEKDGQEKHPVGEGASPSHAVSDLINKVRGECLVVTKLQREYKFQVPKHITIGAWGEI